MTAVVAATCVLTLALAISFLPIIRYMKLASGSLKEAPQDSDDSALPDMATVLFISSMPGEAEFATGGTLSKLLARGNNMYLAILTDGRLPFRSFASFRERAVNKKRNRTRTASAAAGFSDIIFYGLSRKELNASSRAVAMISTLVSELKPAAVFAFDPAAPAVAAEMSSTGRVATEAVEESGMPTTIYYYLTERPNLVNDITETFDGKVRLLSHFDRGFGWRLGFDRVLKKLGLRYGKPLGIKYGEGFRVMNKEGSRD